MSLGKKSLILSQLFLQDIPGTFWKKLVKYLVTYAMILEIIQTPMEKLYRKTCVSS